MHEGRKAAAGFDGTLLSVFTAWPLWFESCRDLQEPVLPSYSKGRLEQTRYILSFRAGLAGRGRRGKKGAGETDLWTEKRIFLTYTPFHLSYSVLQMTLFISMCGLSKSLDQTLLPVILNLYRLDVLRLQMNNKMVVINRGPPPSLALFAVTNKVMYHMTAHVKRVWRNLFGRLSCEWNFKWPQMPACSEKNPICPDQTFQFQTWRKLLKKR